MYKKQIVAIIAILMIGSFFLPLLAMQRGETDMINPVDYADALMLAQYYVGLLPVVPQSENTNTLQNAKVLTIELAGKNTLMPTMDTLYVMPPGKMISSNMELSFEAGTQVKLYFLSTTPPPIPDTKNAPVEYQTASFLEYEGTNINIIMDANKTIRIGYTTQVIISPDNAGQYAPTALLSNVANAE
jgi:hypothetical protein